MLRPIDDLLDNAVVLGAEKKVPKMAEVLGVAVMMARPRDPFLLKWRDAIRSSFQPTCYACHSIALARNLAIEAPADLTPLDWKAFYFPGWENDATDYMYRPLPHDAKQPAARIVADAFKDAYGIHLIESHQNVLPKLKALTERLIHEVDTPFNVLAREYFPK